MKNLKSGLTIISSPFEKRPSVPRPKTEECKVIHRPHANVSCGINHYKNYSENQLMLSNDIETQPGPATRRKHKDNQLHTLIIIILAIVIINKIHSANLYNVPPIKLTAQQLITKLYAATTSNILSTDKLTVQQQSMTQLINQVRLSRKKYLEPMPAIRSTSGFTAILLILAGDVLTNPGPQYHNACSVCKQKDKKHNTVTCETCKQWCHLQCTSRTEDLTFILENSFQWICPNNACTPNHHSGKETKQHLSPNSYSILQDEKEAIQEPRKSNTKKRKTETSQTKKKRNQASKHRSSTPVTTLNRNDSDTNLLSVLTRISSKDYIGKDRCRACHQNIGIRQKAISCDNCTCWTHLKCSDMSPKTYKYNENKEFNWACNTCRTPEEVVEEKADLNRLNPEQLPIANSELSQNVTKDFLILHYNCRSIRNKSEEIHNICYKLQPSILCLTETWLDATSQPTAYVPEGYKIIRQDRQDQFKQKYGKTDGGGIAVIYKDDIKVKPLNIKIDTEETLWVEVKSNPNLIIGTIYRSSYTDLLTENEKGTILESQVTEALYKNRNMIVVGDFNCDTEEEDQDKNTKVLNEVFDSLSMKQLITKPTRIDTRTNKATTIDHVWTDPEINLVREAGTIEGISDHIGIYVKANTAKEKHKPEKSRFRSYRNYQPSRFNEDLKEAIACAELKELIEQEKANEATELWVKIFVETAEKHAPIMEVVKSKKRKFIPWFCRELENLIEEKQKRLQLSRLYGRPSDIKLVKMLSNKITRLKRKCKKAYYTEKLQQYEGEPKKMWKVLKEVTQTENKPNNTEPEFIDQRTANQFNTFFATVGSEIQKRLNIKERSESVTVTGGFKFKEENEEKIIKLIDRIKTDVAVGTDDINARLLKDAKHTIAKTLTQLVNISYKTNTFPSCMKNAKVIAIHKKESTEDPSNYRPLSILSTVSKVFERSAADQLVQFLENNSLLSIIQHAYRKLHSTTTCLSEVVNYIYKENDKGNIVGLASLDLSKAFDSINHNLLIEKLAKLGLGNNSLGWCQSYLLGRTQKTKFKNYTSLEETVTSGVPQGSILGPILFICFTNDMQEIFKNCKVMSYADDTQILVSAKSSTQVKKMLESLIQTAQKWYSENSLLINASKTEVMLITRRRNKEKFEIEIMEDGRRKRIKLKTEIKVLGVYLDEELNWNSQVNAVNKKARYAAINLNRVNQLLPFKSRLTLYNCLVASHFNYADTVWAGCSSYNQSKLQRTQNMAVKSMLGLKRRESSELALKSANLLSLHEKRKIHEAVYIQKGLTGKLPTAINEEYKQHLSLKNNRSADRRILTIPQHKTQQYENSPLYRTIKTWNSIPQDIKDAETSTFKLTYQRQLHNSNTH